MLRAALYRRPLGDTLATVPAFIALPNIESNMSGVELPIDRLPELWPSSLHGARIGAVLHPASVSASLVHSARILERFSGSLLHLAAFFGPQHGYLGQTQDNMIEWEGFRHPRLGIPVHSLYGTSREPTREMLGGLDALVIDLQDIGTRVLHIYLDALPLPESLRTRSHCRRGFRSP